MRTAGTRRSFQRHDADMIVSIDNRIDNLNISKRAKLSRKETDGLALHAVRCGNVTRTLIRC